MDEKRMERIKEKVLLNTYAKNLTEDYRVNGENKPPIIGREIETRKCVEVLSKKYKNNLILVAKAGTGKTALVESLARKLAIGDVPSTLKGKELFEVDLQLLSAPNDDFGGPKKRLKNFIKEVEDLRGDVILFIDEIHIIMGSESEGAMDIANTLKPSLASADGISVIGATTPWEFHKYMEKDAAITRRFSRVNMAEPTPEQAKSILRGRRRGLEIFYGVTLSDEAIDLAVDLSVRYIPSRSLPDKAIDLLDQACASVRVSIDAMPPELDFMQNQLALMREELIQEKDKGNRKALEAKIKKTEPEFHRMYQLWQSQRQILDGLKGFRVNLEKLRVQIEDEQAKDVKDTALIADLEQRFKVNEGKLRVAKESYLAMPDLLIDDYVGENSVRLTLQSMTNIPISEISTDEKEKLRRLEEELHRHVIGQEHAVHEVAYAIKRNRLGLGDPSQPIGSFLMLGPSGVGKSIRDSELITIIRNGVEMVSTHGSIVVGDQVLDEHGKPVLVTGVFPQGRRDVYRITFADDRTVDCDLEHIWPVYKFDSPSYQNMTTSELIEAGVTTFSVPTAEGGRVQIASIEPLGIKDKLTCIMVDSPTHLYQLQNGIVTHNTELVKALAKVMFGSPKAMKRFDMGEFKMESSIHRLIGAPPGEDKDGTGGEITEWAKNNPYSIILFDEAEKAHPAIFDMMLSLLDDGELTDSRGETVDFTNTIVILTSNIGAHKIIRGVDRQTGKLEQKTIDEVNAMLRNPDRDNGGKGFKPEFLNRLDSTPMFLPLKRDEIERIADIKLNGLRKLVAASRKIKLVFSEKIPMSFDDTMKPVIDVSYWLSQLYTHDDLNLGGRPLTRYIRTQIEDPLVDLLLNENVPDGAHVYVQACYPDGPLTYLDDDGMTKPTKPILKIKPITEAEYNQLIKRDPIYHLIK